MKGNLGRVGKVRKTEDIRRYGGHVDLSDVYNIREEKRIFTNIRDDSMWKLNSTEVVLSQVGNWQSIHCSRAINSQSYMNGSSSDYTGPYDVTEVFFHLPTAGNYKLYLAHKVTLSSNIFYNDVPMGAVQILDAEGNVLHFIECTATADEWQTRRSEENVFAAPASPQSLANSTWYNPDNIVESGTATSKRWSYASSTSSPATGAANGLDTTNLDTVPMTVGEGTMPQAPTGNVQYLFRETSSPTSANSWLPLRTKDTYAFPKFGSIRIAYAITTITSSMSDINPEDTFKIAFY